MEAFRQVARTRQALDNHACKELLKHTKRGVLSVIGDFGYPYGMPLNHYYDEEDQTLYFHSGLKGHRNDALRANPKASFCAMDEGYYKEGDWALTFNCVIVFGTVFTVEESEKRLDIIRKLSAKFTSDTDYVEDEIRRLDKATLVYGLKIQHMTGKTVHEQ